MKHFILSLLIMTALGVTVHANPCVSNTTGTCSYVGDNSNNTRNTSRASARSSADAQSKAISQVTDDARAQGGRAQASADNAGVQQSSTDVVERSAAAVSLGIIAPNGCGVGAQGGGSGLRGGGALGFAFTTAECYAFIQADAYRAIGQLKAACELLNTTNAAKRAQRRGFVLPTCEVEVHEVTRVVSHDVPGTYTREQVDEIVKRVLRK